MTAMVLPGVAAGVAAARPAVDWHLSMTHIFQAVTPDHHAELSPFRPMYLYYEGRSLVSPSTHPEGGESA